MIRRVFAIVLTLAVCAFSVAGCGEEESGPGDATDLPTKTIDVSVEGEQITPNGDRIEVQVGQPIELVVKADAEGEIHVHSSPERELKYGAGTTTLPAFTIDKPGVVEVESHALDKIIVQLEVK